MKVIKVKPVISDGMTRQKISEKIKNIISSREVIYNDIGTLSVNDIKVKIAYIKGIKEGNVNFCYTNTKDKTIDINSKIMIDYRKFGEFESRPRINQGFELDAVYVGVKKLTLDMTKDIIQYVTNFLTD
ncbi:hypothetical protein BPT24_281 [Tenacibaculum phage pT24]|uniref:Uncharacterized protein n=1 Tax=Tenacibaculum phage pT24 TaxID=1880590 RepID=A0A1B4XX75_9CAUD|nr:hypothetical protein HYP10_gp247 [Tenacibaculum phage pT24]BAV39398.1 hypothetical protein BPT24_281 [Tenacibaculum phage pT24]